MKAATPVLLIAASIFRARKLAQYDGGKRVPATVAAISQRGPLGGGDNAIDERWPGENTRRALSVVPSRSY